MKRMVHFTCLLLALCGCYDKGLYEAHERRLKELDDFYGYLSRRMEHNDCRHDDELRNIRNHVGITNTLPTFLAYNGGGGLSPEFERLAVRLDDLEEWAREIDSDVNEIKSAGWDCLLEMIEDISRVLDHNCHDLDALSNRLDRLTGP